MIVVMRPRCTEDDVDQLVGMLNAMGTTSHVVEGSDYKVVEVFDAGSSFDRTAVERIPVVDKVLDDSGPMLATDRKPDDETMEVPLGENATVGGQKVAIIAGPCSVESRTQLLETAAAVKEAGAVGLRGGAFKPRTSPYSFQGLGRSGLELLALAREETGLAIVTEVMCRDQIEIVAKYADVLQVGSRNMDHTYLLSALGEQSKPVLLKRGWSASLEEYLFAAEYILRGGNRNVILCERGIRTFERYTRNTLALSVVPELKFRSRLPVLVDPSHGTGRRHLISPMSNAAIACGADGLLIEVHSNPDQAWTDAGQSLSPEAFHDVVRNLHPIVSACGRQL